jgi:hypothetical protein
MTSALDFWKIKLKTKDVLCIWRGGISPVVGLPTLASEPAGYTWTDCNTNTQIVKELKITQILDKLLEYKRNWIQHVNRMPHNRLHRVMKRYSPTGRPLKRLLDT